MTKVSAHFFGRVSRFWLEKQDDRENGDAIFCMVTGKNEHAHFLISRPDGSINRTVSFQVDKQRFCGISRGKLEHAYD